MMRARRPAFGISGSSSRVLRPQIGKMGSSPVPRRRILAVTAKTSSREKIARRRMAEVFLAGRPWHRRRTSPAHSFRCCGAEARELPRAACEPGISLCLEQCMSRTVHGDALEMRVDGGEQADDWDVSDADAATWRVHALSLAAAPGEKDLFNRDVRSRNLLGQKGAGRSARLHLSLTDEGRPCSHEQRSPRVNQFHAVDRVPTWWRLSICRADVSPADVVLYAFGFEPLAQALRALLGVYRNAIFPGRPSAEGSPLNFTRRTLRQSSSVSLNSALYCTPADR